MIRWMSGGRPMPASHHKEGDLLNETQTRCETCVFLHLPERATELTLLAVWREYLKIRQTLVTS